jgi:uncharacterized iron-regulated membrane protein
MKTNSNYLIRKSHRYLGVFLGIQFIFWTFGGLYFSWNNLDKVHGDHLRKHPPLLTGELNLVSPQKALNELNSKEKIDSIISLELVNVLNKPTYRITYLTRDANIEKAQIALVNGQTGDLRGDLSKEEAVDIAQLLYIPDGKIDRVEYITEVDKHSEYREKPLPAWAVFFDHPDSPAIYIGATTGTFEAVRHDTWRTFDFLWMLHTMDFEGRDHFGNKLLQVFSVLGLITVLSGFLLFYISSPTVRKLKKKYKK